MHQRFGMTGVETISDIARFTHDLGMPHVQRSNGGVSKLKLSLGLRLTLKGCDSDLKSFYVSVSVPPDPPVRCLLRVC